MILVTNNTMEIISCLKTINREIEYVKEDINVWKIIIMLQHNAVQATMAKSLTQGDFTKALNKRSSNYYEKYMNDKDKKVKYKEGHLLTFTKLYQKIKCTECLREAYKSNDKSDVNMERLNSFRNNFTHFSVSGWSVDTSHFNEIIIETNHIIKYLVNNKKNMFLIDAKDRENINYLIDSIGEKLKVLEVN